MQKCLISSLLFLLCMVSVDGIAKEKKSLHFIQNQVLLKHFYTAELVKKNQAQLDVHYRSFLMTHKLSHLTSKKDLQILSVCQGDQCIKHLSTKLKQISNTSQNELNYMQYYLYRGCITRGLESCKQLAHVTLNSLLRNDQSHLNQIKKKQLGELHQIAALEACRLDTTHTACGSWADQYLSQLNRSDLGVVFALEHQKYGCSQGNSESCRSLMYHYTQGALGEYYSADQQKKLGMQYAQKSCEFSGNPVSQLCQTYAGLLYIQRDNQSGQQKALSYFKQACEIDSELWTKGCHGDPLQSQEQCNDASFRPSILACSILSSHQKQMITPEVALRINSALCFATDQENIQQLALRSCRRALNTLRPQKNYQRYLNVLQRYCRVQKQSCASSKDPKACAVSQSECDQQIKLVTEMLTPDTSTPHTSSGAGSRDTLTATKGSDDAESGFSHKIRESILASSSTFQACYESHLPTQSQLRGQLVVEFEVALTGKVSQARVTSSELNHPEMERCVLQTIHKLSFPPRTKGNLFKVRYPLFFDTK